MHVVLSNPSLPVYLPPTRCALPQVLLKGDTTAFKVAISKAEVEALTNVEAAHHNISGALLMQNKKGKWREHFFWTTKNFLVFSNEAGGVVISGVDLRASECIVEHAEYEGRDGQMEEGIKVVGRRDGGAITADGLPDADPELIAFNLQVPHHDDTGPTTEHWRATLLAAQRDLREKIKEMQKDRFRLLMHPIPVAHAKVLCAKLELVSGRAKKKLLKKEFKALPAGEKKVRTVLHTVVAYCCVESLPRMQLHACAAPPHSLTHSLTHSHTCTHLLLHSLAAIHTMQPFYGSLPPHCTYVMPLHLLCSISPGPTRNVGRNIPRVQSQHRRR